MKRPFALLLSLALIVPSAVSSAPAPAAPPPPPAPVPTKQPMIQVSVDSLEISDQDSKNIGLIWGTPGDNGAITNNQLNFFETSVPSLFKVGTIDRGVIAGQLNALIQHGQARILANPTLLTKSGFEANFLVGGEIPYPTIGQGGAQGVEYKKYGVALKILPQLTPANTIDAQINVGVSDPDKSVAITLNGLSVPGLASRETGTKVEIKDGETVVLSGIKQSRREKTVTKVPVLGYIPILGWLFRNTSETTRQTSLVLFVTFKLIK